MFLITEKKEKLSDMEQQLKKTEAAQRRRIQVEKANRESEVSFSRLLSCICFSIKIFIYRGGN